MKKIEIKLKECRLKCEHFDPSGIQGLSPYSIPGCGEPDRVIACGHMAVCKKYNYDESESVFGWIVNDYTPCGDEPEPGKYAQKRKVMYECPKCGREAKEKTTYCPHCGTMNIKDETR